MYTPSHFAEQRPDVLHALMRAHPLAAVVSQRDGELVADHIPLFLDINEAGQARLIGHVAKANPLWQASADTPHLLIFQGAQSYISPNWYATKAQSHKVVPTWNYCVVHAQATLRSFADATRLVQLLNQLTNTHENRVHQGTTHAPWRVADAPADYTANLLDHIVGVEFVVTQLHGKWKTSQNQPAINRASIQAALAGRPNANDQGNHKTSRF